MKEELTREVVEAMARCTETQDCVDKCAAYKFCNGKYWTVICSKLATALLEEMDKPKAWDGAPDNAYRSIVNWYDKSRGFIKSKVLTRELPKTRARIMAEEIATALTSSPRYEPAVEIIETALEKYAAELGTET